MTGVDGAAVAAMVAAAAAGEAESPGKWTEVMQRGSEEACSQHTSKRHYYQQKTTFR